ncbi:TIGR04086 family membrane protein [Pontibacillus litoralis]|uniref:Membrane protein n=1 Tax=Pontibacillus litoralis JSM 072002 TaxID=1385512 RepID=A0A0A5GAH8_9BACI|nr:TIGR04086 family membrane protein [Pontibacillus litoralis]KGX88994.1 membrane protein [Pontibacillus litoralis JSM 072002]
MQNRIVAIVYGWVFIFIAMAITSLLLALILKFTAMTESTLQWTTLIAGLLILFVSGVITGVKGKEQGWLLGLLTGGGFSIIVFLFQFLAYQKGVGVEQLFSHLSYMIMALLGGMIGVNISGGDQSS